MVPFATGWGFVHATHNPRLIISEVHPNVLTDGLSIKSVEWVELHNPERYAANLRGWTLEDGQSINPLPDIEIVSGGTVLVVGRSADLIVPAGRTLIILDSPRIGTGLRNAGDRIALVKPNGVRHDAVSWGDVRQPYAIDPPNPGQSIVRTPAGGQSLTNTLTPWTTREAISATPERHRHLRPDSKVRITSSVVDPVEGDSESVTIKNISDEPLLTINWTLTVGASLVRLRSVRIEPGATHTITGAENKLGSGLSIHGGHLVLRDSKGNWLATASWGADETFHRLPAPAPGEELQFSPLTRIHPRTPWFEAIEHERQLIVHARLVETSPLPANASAVTVRERHSTSVIQQSQEHTVWISEVYPTAGQGRADHQYEWFELTNSTDQEVSLDGWTIADNTSSDSLDGVIVPPGASMVIAASANAGPEAVVAITDGRIGNGLANAGDQLRLINPQGEIVSAISWGTDHEYTSAKSPKTDESIHRRSPVAAPTIGSPSPGESNAMLTSGDSEDSPIAASDATQSDVESLDDRVEQSETPATTVKTQSALRITEILPAPLPGQPEWVEIHNQGDRAIDLSGWTIGDAEGQTELSGVIPPESRLVITTQELELDAPTLLVNRIGNGLNNDGDTIYIYDSEGLVVDFVTYGNDTLPAPDRGLSIALDPERWLVTARPTPGEEGVTSLLDDSFRSASTKQPISDDGRLPIVQSEPDRGSDAWMIVSFALIGVILTLIIRRWRPDEPEPEPVPEPTTFTGPVAGPSPDEELEHGDKQTPR